MNAIVFSQYSFGLTPKIFNTIDMIFSPGKLCRMVNSLMMKLAHIKRIIRALRISIDNAIWLDFTRNNGHQRPRLGVRNHDRVNFSLAF